MDCTGWIRMQEAIQTHSWRIVTWRHTMEDGPCATLLMNMSNPRLKLHTALGFLMEVTATGPTVTTSQWVDSLMFYDRLSLRRRCNREIGPLQVTWYGINYAGTQITRRDLQNKREVASEAGLVRVLLFCKSHSINQSITLFIIWLAPWAGKMNQIARCDWLPERARWSHLARSGLPAVSREQNFTKSHIINPLLTKFVRSKWLDIGLVLFFASLWTSTSSRSINTQKKNLANIQPSWPHTWSITHTYPRDHFTKKWSSKEPYTLTLTI